MDIEKVIVDAQGAQSVEHHLRILLCFDQHTLTVLEVDDVQSFICDDDAVTGTEPVRHVA